MKRLELLLAFLVVAGCASTDARWEAGVTRTGDRELPALLASDVAVYFKKEFGAFELEGEKRPFACHSTTLVRRMGLLERDRSAEPPPGKVVVLGELTTEEYPRDDQRSKLKGREFSRTFGFGGDEIGLFECYPSSWAAAKGVARLREMAAAIGADEVRDVYYTGYAEYQMWQGTSFSLTPTSTDAFLYANIELLDWKLRDVRFHGTAVRRRSP